MYRFLPLLVIVSLLAPANLMASKTERFVMDNGLTVLLREERSAPLLTMQVWVKTGSNTEAELMGSGMSHFVEHMLFKGTKRRKVGQYAREIASYGGRLNAYTTNDRTVYFFTIGSKYFDEGLDAISDVMMNATLPADETVKEQEVIRREIAMGNDSPGRQLWQTLMRTAFLHHPYKVPVIGYLPTFNNLTRQDLVDYYKKRYVPNNSICVIVGDFDAQEARKKVEKTFSAWKRTALEPVFYPQEPEQVAPREVEREFAVKKTTCYLAWPSMAVTDKDVFAADVLSLIAGRGKTSRLYRRLVEEEQIVESIGTSNWTPEDKGLFLCSMVLDYEKLDRAIELVTEEFDKLKNELVTDKELKRAIALVVSGTVRQRETIEGIAGSIGSGELRVGNPEFDEYYDAEIKKVTAEQVRQAARKYLVAKRRNKVVFKPKGTGKGKVAKDGKPSRKALLAQLRNRVKKQKTKKRKATPDVWKGALSNGMKTLVYERPRLPLVAVAISFKGGSRYEKGFQPGTASFMTEMLVKGTKKRTAKEIAEAFENVGGSLPVVANSEVYGIRAIVLKEHLDMAVDVLCDVLMNSTFPEKEIEKQRRLQLAAVKTERDQPFRNAMLNFYELRYGKEHPWGRSNLGTQKSVKAIDRAELVRYFEASCAPDNGCLSIVGDVDRKQIVAKFDKKLRAWRARSNLSEPMMVPKITKPIKKKFADPGKQQMFVILGFAGAEFGSHDELALEVYNNVVGGMGNRLFRNLRGKKSLAYQVGCWHGSGSDKRSQIFYLVTQPKRKQEAIDGLEEELTDSQVTMPDKDTLQRAINKVVGATAIDLQENRALAATFAYHELLGSSWKYPFEKNAKVEAMTADDVIAVAKKYINFKKQILVTVGP